MIFRDEKNARQMLSAEEPAAKPVGFGVEAFNSAWDAVRREEQSVSMDRAFGERFGSYIDEVEKLTGTRLKSPIQPRSNFSPSDLLFHGGKRGARESDYNGFLEQVNELRASRDDVPEPPDPNTMLEEIIADYDVKRREHQDLRSRQTAGGAFADFLGSAVGAIEDPAVLATLPFGASAGAGVLRTALTEAGISMAVDVPIQFGAVAETKDVLGVEFGPGDAAANVLMAGALAGGAGAAIAGAVKGVKALSNRGKALSAPDSEVRRRRPVSAIAGDQPAVKAEASDIASDRQVLEEYKSKVATGEVKETPQTRKAASDLERDIDIADTNPNAKKSVEGGIEHEANFNKAYEALQRGTPMSVPVQKPGREIAASSGDDIISEIMTETQLPKAIQARFHETVSEVRTQVSVSAPAVFGRTEEYDRLIARQDELLSTPRTKKNRAKLNKEIAQIAGQLDELQQTRVVASASRDKSVDEYWNVDRPADDIAEEEADQVLKADLERAIEEHGEDFEIPVSETIDEATGERAAATTSLRQMVMELDEADKVADEFANCLLGASEVAA
ncbi:MAG: hypothetical protein ACR2QF_04825 [Geminicoccaceae bacterium]